MEIKSSVEIDLIFDDDDVRNSATPHFCADEPKPKPQQRDTPIPRVANPSTPLQSVPEEEDIPGPDETRVNIWSPDDVSAWMRKLKVDERIVNTFFRNDISGSILLELKPADLKELDIQSFGKRHELMASIRQLCNSFWSQSDVSQTSIPSEPVSREPTPGSTTAEVGIRSCNATPIGSSDASSPSKEIDEHHRRRQHRRHRQRVITPNDSVSIIGIEQVLPRPHRCSKGEECRKWQKQQAKIARFSHDLPAESSCSPVIIAGDPGNAATAPNMVKTPKSDVTPSIVASSDALGPRASEMPISAKTLQDVAPRDAQENVRHFLKLQRLSQLQPVEKPATPPRETFPSPDADSPGNLSEKLQKLPTLRIPSSHDSFVRNSTVSPVLSGQRTITPSVTRRKQPFQQTIPEHTETPCSSIYSPSDYYRQDPRYGLSPQTPVSEIDVPLTAIPVGPIERVFSQSVPPDMRFGYSHDEIPEPFQRPISTKVENHGRKLSVNISQPALRRLDEGRVMSPIETPEDLERTPRAAHCRANPFSPTGGPNKDIIHSGWVKKRKTKNLLGHTWQEYHCALRENKDSTDLALYTDEASACQNSKALEYIDVDDYAVACSSLASCSKLTAQFKRTFLKRKDDTKGDTAFAFSLIPSPKHSSTFDRKAIFNSSKSHHFAVKTRDERIDWMRELMLAKALRRGRESGASLNLNGNIV